jgi:hypothetical protein
MRERRLSGKAKAAAPERQSSRTAAH